MGMNVMDELTDSEDFNFAEIHVVIDQRKLDNDVCEAQSTIKGLSTLYSDCGSSRYSTWILTTQSVTPQNRCASLRTDICQTNDEIVRSVTYTESYNQML